MDQTGGFALSPYVPFRDGIVGLSKLGSEAGLRSPLFSAVPHFSSKEEGRPQSRPRKRTTSRGLSLLCGEHSEPKKSLAHSWPRHRLRYNVRSEGDDYATTTPKRPLKFVI